MDSHPVAVLVYDGLCAFEFGAAAEVFGLKPPHAAQSWYSCMTCSEEARPVVSQGGARILAEHGLDRLEQARTVVVPGWREDGVPASPAVIQALRSAHARGARMVALCTGTFMLAEAGLLLGRRATTHWGYVELLRARHPTVLVDPDVLYVDDGDVLTSAGWSAGLDLLVHLVRKDHGPAAALELADRLVTPAHRAGNLAQRIARPVPQRAGQDLAPLLDLVRVRLDERWTIARLATLARMSPRTFLRRFAETTGQSPASWLAGTRCQAARDLLETTRHGLDDIAAAVGFGSASALRRQLARRYGTSPSALRRPQRPLRAQENSSAVRFSATPVRERAFIERRTLMTQD